jgi:sporulation protein YlmC with PRC-barrel domain
MTDIEKVETASLIASNKVEGTAVYGIDGDKLGSIYNFMVDKRLGQVEYAVLQFGGMLGLGSDFYPLPWEVLEYDEDQGGYVVELTKDQLKEAPHFAANEEPEFTPAYRGEIYGAYGLGNRGTSAH